MKQTTEANSKNKQPSPTRNPRTKIFVFFEDQEGHRGVNYFDFMPELQEWMTKTNVKVLKIVRGVEKNFKTTVRLS